MTAGEGLRQLVRACVESLAPEAESAARWADSYDGVADRSERARRMIGDLSARVVAAGHPRSFVQELPGVQGILDPEAAYLVFRMVKVQLYVAGAQAHQLEDTAHLELQCLLLMGLAFGLPEFLQGGTHRGGAARILRKAFPEGLAPAWERVAEELEARVRRLRGRPSARAFTGAFEFLTMAAAADLADAWYNDLQVTPEELEAVRRASAERAAAVFGLLRQTARADGLVGGEEQALLAVALEALPTVDPEALRGALDRLSIENLPKVLRYAEERAGLLECMLTIAAADGVLDPTEERLCREVARLLEVPDAQVERLLARLVLLRKP